MIVSVGWSRKKSFSTNPIQFEGQLLVKWAEKRWLFIKEVQRLHKHQNKIFVTESRVPENIFSGLETRRSLAIRIPSIHQTTQQFAYLVSKQQHNNSNSNSKLPFDPRSKIQDPIPDLHRIDKINVALGNKICRPASVTCLPLLFDQRKKNCPMKMLAVFMIG